MADDQPSDGTTSEGKAGTDALEERLASLEESVAALRADLDEKIDDVRQRVVQVKREADGKAPADHGHPELEERIESAAGDGSREADIERLSETSRDLERKLDQLARITVGLRDTVDRLAAAAAEDAAVAELARSANAHGARDADCGNCGEPVDIALLSEPRCPHCSESFEEFTPKEWVFGSHVLEVGSHPVLEPADEAGREDIDAVLDARGDGSGRSPDGDDG